LTTQKFTALLATLVTPIYTFFPQNGKAGRPELYTVLIIWEHHLSAPVLSAIFSLFLLPSSGWGEFKRFKWSHSRL